MNEKKPEPTVETQSIRRQYNMVLEETKSIIDDDIKQIRISAIVLQYRELLNLCDIIDRLTEQRDYKDKAIKQQKKKQKNQAKEIKELGDYLCLEHNDNYGQGVCERACDIIDRLTADLKAKDEALEKIIIESGKVDIDNWPKQQQICQSIAESALKESDNG